MKLKRLPVTDEGITAMLTRIVKLEDESGEDEPWEESTIPAGTYALDTLGRVWKLEDTMTDLFQGLGLKEKKA